jgi:hypothetical protein
VIKLDDIPTLSLVGILSVLKSSHEFSEIAAAEETLKDWGITYKDGHDEIVRRNSKLNQANESRSSMQGPY